MTLSGQPKIQLNDVTADVVRDAAREFIARGIVRLPRLLSYQDHELLLAEAKSLLEEHGQRRDFAMTLTDSTPRHMHNVDGRDILRDSALLRGLYDDTALRSLVAGVIGEPALVCPYERERIVITYLDREGDTHGWHWDDYSIALVWVVQAPPIDCGGVVQCVPNTRWNRSSPDILAHLVANPIHSYYFSSGEAYIMQTRHTLHRVHPLVQPNRARLIINFAFATQADSDVGDQHETVEALWSPPPQGRAS